LPATGAKPKAPKAPKAAARKRASLRSGTILMLQARALAPEQSAAAALAVCTELALLANCARVSIGFRSPGRMHVAAISGVTDIRQRQNLIRLMVAAMDEAADQRSPVVHPQPRGAAPLITLAQGELARVGGHLAILAVPILSRERTLGALLFERDTPFDERATQLARDAALLVGPLLEVRHRLDAPIAQRAARLVSNWWHPEGRHARRRRRFVRPTVVAAGAAILALAAIVPIPERVVAPARIEGSIQRVVAAPVDGFVQVVEVRPGEAVREGQLLLTLDDRDLHLERERARSEIAQLDKAYGEALTQDDAARIAMARARLDQARAQFALAEEQLSRSQLRAPFDGIVISGDLVQSIGMPVKRGEELMTIAPDQDFRAVIEADEQDIAGLAVGQSAQILFAAWTGAPVTVTIDRIAPIATVIGDRNVFELEAPVDAMEALRPGLRGVARVEVGRRSWVAIQYDRIARWGRRTAWQVLG